MIRKYARGGALRLFGRTVGLGVIAAGLVVVASCGGDSPQDTVTTTSEAPVTTARPTTTAPPLTTSPETTSTTRDDPGETAISTAQIPGDDPILYRVIRQESTRDGIRLFLDIPPGAYSDIDLENLVLSIFEERDDLYELHVFDKREAVGALIKPEEDRTPEDAQLLERHYLVSLLEGSMIRFQGPFADVGGYVVGS